MTIALYRGAGIATGGRPGTINELVPLPLLMTVPPVAEPGIMMVWEVPVVPVTRPGPAGVRTDPVAGGGDALVCAQAAPDIARNAAEKVSQGMCMIRLRGVANAS
jgi:hypothetical protein